MGLVPPLCWWRYGIYLGHMGPINLSLSLFSLTHDLGHPKVRRQDGGEGPSCLPLCRVASDGAQAFPGDFSPTVHGVEGRGSSLSPSLSHPSYLVTAWHWNGPECAWPPPVVFWKVQYRRGGWSLAQGFWSLRTRMPASPLGPCPTRPHFPIPPFVFETMCCNKS